MQHCATRSRHDLVRQSLNAVRGVTPTAIAQPLDLFVHQMTWFFRAPPSCKRVNIAIHLTIASQKAAAMKIHSSAPLNRDISTKWTQEANLSIFLSSPAAHITVSLLESQLPSQPFHTNSLSRRVFEIA